VSVVRVGSGVVGGGVRAGAGGVGVDPFIPLVGAGVVLVCPSYPMVLSLVLEVVLVLAALALVLVVLAHSFLPLVDAGAMLMCPLYSSAVALVLVVLALARSFLYFVLGNVGVSVVLVGGGAGAGGGLRAGGVRAGVGVY
jgi:hypothetical protein